MPLVLPYTFCSQADMERMFSTLGLLSRVDHDADGVANAVEAQSYQDGINMGTETVSFYLYSRYDPARLAQSVLVNRWATIYGCYHLCGYRGNPIPETLLEWAEDAEDKLTQIQLRRATLPGVPVRRTQAPVWDNVRVDPRYTFKCIRVERGRSSQQPNALPVVADWSESWCWEI